MSDPLAYLITWTTYGSWVHGDDRGWVTRAAPGIQAPDPALAQNVQERLTHETLTLDPAQRDIVEETIRRHCEIRRWTLHALNVRSNHVHVVVTAPVTPEDVMSQFKAWCSRRLSEHVRTRQTPVPADQKWWTRHGSTKWINDEQYLANAIRYVLERQ